QRRTLPSTGVRYENPKQPPCLTLSVSDGTRPRTSCCSGPPGFPADAGAATREPAERCQKAARSPRTRPRRRRDLGAGQACRSSWPP
ncbi:MAG: hypothetical protein V8S34_02305, partial [Lawsonibacter sp.]